MQPQYRILVTASGIVSFGYAAFLSLSLVRLVSGIKRHYCTFLELW